MGLSIIEISQTVEPADQPDSNTSNQSVLNKGIFNIDFKQICWGIDIVKIYIKIYVLST